MNWTINVEPRGDTYYELLRTACSRGALGGFVVQGGQKNASFFDFMREFEPYIISAEETNEWPGTIQGYGDMGSSRDHPKFYKFSLKENILSLLTTHASGLYDWISPCLPEDLCFFDNRGQVWMTTISHERDAYLTLSQSELNEILKKVPKLSGQWDLG